MPVAGLGKRNKTEATGKAIKTAERGSAAAPHLSARDLGKVPNVSLSASSVKCVVFRTE